MPVTPPWATSATITLKNSAADALYPALLLIVICKSPCKLSPTMSLSARAMNTVSLAVAALIGTSNGLRPSAPNPYIPFELEPLSDLISDPLSALYVYPQ